MPIISIKCHYCPRRFEYDDVPQGRGSPQNRAKATRGVHEKAAHYTQWLEAKQPSAEIKPPIRRKPKIKAPVIETTYGTNFCRHCGCPLT